MRVAKPGKKPGFKSTIFTFTTSAFWHGTRPGYYLTFVVGALMQTVGKYYRRNFRPIFLEADGKTPKPAKIVYDFVCWVNTQLAFGFFVQPFVILGFTKSLECWATVYYWLLWVIAISFFAFSGPFAKSVSKFFKSLQPSYREQQRKSREDKYKLNNEEASIVEQAVGAKLGQDYDIPALGLPPFDVFTDFDQTEVDHDIQHLRKAWTSFRGRRGSITENDFDGLKDAYNNFTNEINDIFNTKKEEFKKEKLNKQN